MRNKISALIIDPQMKKHDYRKVTTENVYKYYISYGELGFDLKVIPDTSNIMTDLNAFKGVDCIITVGDLSEIDFSPLNNLSFEFRKKWIHEPEFEPTTFAHHIIDVFLYNINRVREQSVKLFSVFTCTYKTSTKMFDRLYNSLCNQTYRNWNWYILDDSPNGETAERMAKKNDPRIVIIRNITNHGNIGFNKRTIAMACDGDYLVEVDHDDELTPDCLELLNKAFTQFPDSDFVYSHAMEEINGKEVCYGDNFAYGLGEYRDMDVLGTTRHIALTAEVNALSVRGIHALPNHVRCWKADFYRKIGGHNPELAVLDDMDILIRTFLRGKMTLVDKVLYVQHEGNSTATSRGETTQSARFKEIQRTNEYLRMKYDVDLHNRIIELGAIDPFWVNETIGSDIRRRYDKKDLVNFNHKLEC
jgi:glycosyltransferase involved in cell wall biosynthesis